MKIRLISGSVYVLMLATFFLLKIFAHDLAFDALIWFFAVMGTFEMTRALKEKITKAEQICTWLFAIICIPSCSLFESVLFGGGYGVEAAAVCFLAFAVAVLSLLVAKHEETSLESVGVTLLSGVYPTMLLCVLSLCNHFDGGAALSKYAFNSNLAILFIFGVSPVADSLAYVFGRLLKGKFPKKMAPVVSPNKTVVGGIGGLFGGVLAGVVLYFAYNGVCGSFDKAYLFLPVYLGVGLVSAIATAWGDLIESCVKRKVGLKDMGKIMPGHGGVLDRIDGTLFASIVVYAAFTIVKIIL